MAGDMFRDGLFEGERALITGGGSGIGLTVAKELGRLGASVAICGRRPEPLEAARAELEAMGVTAYAASCDIRDPERVRAFVGEAADALGGLDILVNNAGGQFPSPAQFISPKGFEAVVRNNLLGTWTMIHAVANQVFLKQKRGRIVNVVAQVERGFPGMVHTGAARAGVMNVTQTLAVEWAYHGVRVNAVAPGIIRTSGTKQYPPELLERGRQSTPLKRLGTAQEVSHLICYLASRQADFVTGQTVLIDGGQSLWGESWEIADEVPNYAPYPDE
jgi:citronellol/citronellal dehydrogenase